MRCIVSLLGNAILGLISALGILSLAAAFGLGPLACVGIGVVAGCLAGLAACL